MDVKQYWRDMPGDAVHGFGTYAAMGDTKIAEVFYEFMRICPPPAHVVEIGCNTGSNLDYLRRKGFNKFTGIEINAGAVENFKTIYPETYAMTKAMVGDALPAVRSLETASCDAIFTRGVLINIPYEDEAIFAEMARVTRNIVIIMEADPIRSGEVLFPRDYEKIFAGLGFHLILKKLLIGGYWGQVDPNRAKDPWLRVFIRNSITPTPIT